MAKALELVLSPAQCYIALELDMECILEHHLDVDADKVAAKLVAHKALKLKTDRVVIKGKSLLHVYSPDTDAKSTLFGLQRLADRLPDVPVCGINGVTRAVVHKQGAKEETPEYCLMIEGDAFEKIMNTVGVDGPNTDCNHIIEVEKVLG